MKLRSICVLLIGFALAGTVAQAQLIQDDQVDPFDIKITESLFHFLCFLEQNDGEFDKEKFLGSVDGLPGDVAAEILNLDGDEIAVIYQALVQDFGSLAEAGIVCPPGGHAVPEPSTYGIIGASALLGLIAFRRFKRMR